MMDRRIIIGVDEVGRGALAAQVVAAAVILPERNCIREYPWIETIKDSKKLSAKKREKLSSLICEHCVWGIGEVSARYVDMYNILEASLKAMAIAVNKVYGAKWKMLEEEWGRSVPPPKVTIMVDGVHFIPFIELNSYLKTGAIQHAVKDGDSLLKEVGAASIVAKVYRDEVMRKLDLEYPGYGFSKNKGYGTREHRQAIMELGVSPIHRKTFGGVREYV